MSPRRLRAGSTWSANDPPHRWSQTINQRLGLYLLDVCEGPLGWADASGRQ